MFCERSGRGCSGSVSGLPTSRDLLHSWTQERFSVPMRRRCFWIAHKPVTIAEAGSANHRFFSPTAIDGIHNIRLFAVPTTLEQRSLCSDMVLAFQVPIQLD